MCAQPFSGISFIKYDYSQYILELNKIKKKIGSKNRQNGLSTKTKNWLRSPMPEGGNS